LTRGPAGRSSLKAHAPRVARGSGAVVADLARLASLPGLAARRAGRASEADGRFPKLDRVGTSSYAGIGIDALARVDGRVQAWVGTEALEFDTFAVTAIEPQHMGDRPALALARPIGDMQLIPCGMMSAGLTEAGLREIDRALCAGRAVFVEVEYHGTTPAGELRHPVLWSFQVV
jgi:hypothetical protein